MATPTLNLGTDASARLSRALADPSINPDDAVAAAQQYQARLDQAKQTHTANIGSLDTISQGFKNDAARYGKSEFGVPSLGYTLNDPSSSANLTKLAPLAIGAALTPFTGGLSLGAASGIIGAGTGAAELARQSGNGEQFDPGKAGVAGVESGLSNFVGGKILGAVGSKLAGGAPAAESGGSNIVGDAGDALRRSVLNPSVKTSPFMSEEEQALQSVAQKYGLKGSSANQASQLPGIFRNIQGKIRNLLQASDYTVPTEDFRNELEQAVINHGDTNFSPTGEAGSTMTNNAYKKTLNLLFKGKGDVLSAQDLYEMKQTASNQLNFNKANPTEADMVKQAFFDNLKGALNNVSPDIAKLNQNQNAIYDISHGLASSEKIGLKVPFANVEVPGGIVQAGKDLIGRGLQATGGALGKINFGTLAKDIPTSSLIGGAQGAALAGSGVSSLSAGAVGSTDTTPSLNLGTTAQPTSDQGSTAPWQPGQSMSRAQYAALIAKDLGTTGGRFGPQITAAFQAQNPDVTTGISTAANAIGTLSDLYQKAGGGAGKIGGSIKDVLGATSYAQKDVKTYNDNASALGQEIISQIYGTGGKAEDRDQVLNSIPKITDSAYEANKKIGILKSLLAGRLGANQNSTAGQINNQLSAPSLNLNQ